MAGLSKVVAVKEEGTHPPTEGILARFAEIRGVRSSADALLVAKIPSVGGWVPSSFTATTFDKPAMQPSYTKENEWSRHCPDTGVRPGRGRLHEGVVFGTILSICSSSVLEAPHVRSLEFSGSPTTQDPAAIPERSEERRVGKECR